MNHHYTTRVAGKGLTVVAADSKVTAQQWVLTNTDDVKKTILPVANGEAGGGRVVVLKKRV